MRHHPRFKYIAVKDQDECSPDFLKVVLDGMDTGLYIHRPFKTFFNLTTEPRRGSAPIGLMATMQAMEALILRIVVQHPTYRINHEYRPSQPFG